MSFFLSVCLFVCLSVCLKYHISADGVVSGCHFEAIYIILFVTLLIGSRVTVLHINLFLFKCSQGLAYVDAYFLGECKIIYFKRTMVSYSRNTNALRQTYGLNRMQGRTLVRLCIHCNWLRYLTVAFLNLCSFL